MNIRDYKETDKQAWEDFVGSSPGAKICHHLCYKDFIEEVFGYHPVYWIFEKDGEIAGVFPSFEYRNIFGRKYWISQPFIEYGGVLSKGLLEEDWMLFKERVEAKLQTDALPALKMNGFDGEPSIFQRQKLYEYGYLNLRDPRKIWADSLDRQARKAVNKAVRSGLSCHEETTEAAIKEKFYPIYLKSMKRLGSPPFSLKYFLAKRAAFGEKMKLFLIKNNKKEVLAALLGYAFNKNIFIEFSVSLEEGLAERPNDLAHWKFIEWAASKDYEYFDFGSIRYETQKRYKKKWGIELRVYVNSYIFNPQQASKQYYLESSEEGIQLLSKLWHWLMPEILARHLGPFLHKQLVR